MEAIHYGLTKHFPKCNKYIEEYIIKPTYEANACINGQIAAMGLGNKFDKKKSNAALSYASMIKGNSKYVSKESLCLYLYYWLDNESKEHHITQIDKDNIYDNLIKIGNNNVNICKSIMYQIKKNNELIETIKAIHDIYKSVYILKDYCEDYDYDKLCYVVNVFNNEDKMQEKTNSCKDIKPVIQTIYKNNTIVPIIITISVMLIILIFIFIIIKFIPHRSYMHRLIRRIINKNYNINDEWNIIKPPGINSFNIDDCRYDILYNRD
ncbi:variable surface protein [Plasmodium gonderi]|uniref:Variable surface protein n=1 Tax=Plasmodium gonderi TaxID=77519 RepID=A0A1Y1JMG1_PLAGO|nr:variable surface protein [Plasmodium gonderi]GAW82022.1 variable surface protein [Plasmodium gonderi]